MSLSKEKGKRLKQSFDVTWKNIDISYNQQTKHQTRPNQNDLWTRERTIQQQWRCKCLDCCTFFPFPHGINIKLYLLSQIALIRAIQFCPTLRLWKL